MNSLKLALLPSRNFAVFERQFLLKYYTQSQEFQHVLRFTSSLVAQSQFLSNLFISVSKSKNANNDVSMNPPITFYAEVTKRNGDDQLESALESCRLPLKGYLKEKYYPLGIVNSREFHNSKEIHCRNYPSHTFNFHLQRQLEVLASTTEERKVLHH